MRNVPRSRPYRLAALSLLVSAALAPSFARAALPPTPTRDAGPAPMAEWTMLLFLNGNNNLDPYGTQNLNQMETVGSTPDVNVVVQWASEARGTVQRLRVEKDQDPDHVTSPVLQDMGTQVDMGDWHSVVDFVRWGAQNFPARHYFVAIWDHGTGWHRLQAQMRTTTRGLGSLGLLHPLDISLDDKTGHMMTTQEMGQALRESSRVLGQKIDLYASDACLMAMIEVAAEVADSVRIYAGSQETEPAEGWPYDRLLAQWTARPTMSASEVAGILTQEYVKSYAARGDGTFSAYDLSQLSGLERAISELGNQVRNLAAGERKTFVESAKDSQHFTYADYVDLVDLLGRLDRTFSSRGGGLDKAVRDDVRSAIAKFMVAEAHGNQFGQAHGVSIWVPKYQSSMATFLDDYKKLQFDQSTGWGSAMSALFQ